MKKCFFYWLVSLLSFVSSVNAKTDFIKNYPFDFYYYGDARLRFESDFNNHTLLAQNRVNNRNRLRIRTRLGAQAHYQDWLKLNIRFRTGVIENQQSANVTVYDFNNNDNNQDLDFHFDRYYIKLQSDKNWLWVGRNDFPFFSQDEIFWDDDVTILGFASGLELFKTNNSYIHLNTGLFTLPVGMREFSGSLLGAEAVYTYKTNDITYQIAQSFFDFNAHKQDKDAILLRNGNGLRDYSILISNLEITKMINNLPYTLGFDWLYNIENYSENNQNLFTAQNHNQNNGYVGKIILGDLKKKHDWLFGYYYAYIENLAVNNSYEQNIWSRFGSAGIKGHQFKFNYALTDNWELSSRFFNLRNIDNHKQNNRFRFDVSYRF